MIKLNYLGIEDLVSEWNRMDGNTSECLIVAKLIDEGNIRFIEIEVPDQLYSIQMNQLIGYCISYSLDMSIWNRPYGFNIHLSPKI